MFNTRTNRTHQLVRIGWVLAVLMVILKPTTAVNTEIDEDQRFPVKHVTLPEFLEVLNLLAHYSSDDPPMTAATFHDILMQRTRKSGSSRPKYDPGLKWIGLGKRRSAPISPQLFTDLRQFFQAARNELIHQYQESAQDNPENVGDPKEGSPEVASKGVGLQDGQRDSIEALKFVPRSQESAAAPPKSLYNPSLLWTGLGR